MASPILVTGAAGRVGGVGRGVTELLLKQAGSTSCTGYWSGLPVVRVRPVLPMCGCWQATWSTRRLRILLRFRSLTPSPR